MTELTTTSSVEHHNILGVILAGGNARRMGGGDKGFADLDGQTMLAHVIARFRPQVSQLILSANGDAARFRGFGLDVVADLDAIDRGPISGLFAAMTWIENKALPFDAVATVSTDVPFLPLDCVQRLEAARAMSGDAARPALAVSGERRHPTVGLWPMSLKSEIAAALARNDLRLNMLAHAHSAIEVAFAFSECGGETVDPFFNANTPDDLAMARDLITRQL